MIKSIGALEALPGDRYVNGWSTRTTVLFDLPDQPRHLQITWESRLNRYQNRCGCATGAVCLLLTLLSGTVLLASTAKSFFSIQFLGRACLLVFLSGVTALIGKAASLAVTRIQFSLSCRRIVRQIAAGSLVRNLGSRPEV